MAATCKDCRAEGIVTKRATPHPGPRCSSHHRARRTVTRDTAWERRLIALYGITADEYWEIYKHQGGVCYICQRARGTGKRRLSVDHDHATGFIRGLTCSVGNKYLGHARDDIGVFFRGARYLAHPPAWDVIGQRIAPIEAQRLTKNGVE